MMDPTKTNPRLKAVRIDPSGEARNYACGGQQVTLVPLTIRRRQNRKILTPPPDARSMLGAGGLDAPMIKTLGKAFYWQQILDGGKYETVTELAKALRLETGWVAEVLRMTLLAPDIVEAILDGRQPRHLNLHVLRGRGQEWPRDWRDQRDLLNRGT